MWFKGCLKEGLKGGLNLKTNQTVVRIGFTLLRLKEVASLQTKGGLVKTRL